MKKKWLLYGVAAMAACGVALTLLFYNGILLFNNPSEQKYPVRGVDVSSYQGEIDWQMLEQQNIQFAFIKATEGSTHVDAYYQQNYENVLKTELRVGAYHFFSFDSPGIKQAQNFISVVAKTDNMLPPVADVEYYADKEQNSPAKEGVVKELTAFLLELEEHYGQKPLIYATEKSYAAFISGGFADYDIWIRDVIFRPTLTDNRGWTFWQYTNREVLDGYAGKEKFIDMNVFYGNQEEFANYGK